MILDLFDHSDVIRVVFAFQPMPWTLFLRCQIAVWRRSKNPSLILKDGAIVEPSPGTAWLIDDEPFVVTALLLVSTFVENSVTHLRFCPSVGAYCGWCSKCLCGRVRG